MGPAYNGYKDAKETTCYKLVHIVIELFYIDLDAKKLVHYGWVLIVSELVGSGSQCI